MTSLATSHGTGDSEKDEEKKKLVVKGVENHILKAYLEGVTEGRECANDYSVTLVNQGHHRYVIYIAYFFLQFYFSNSVFLFSRELFSQLIASFQKII
jgi:hypothetical protein